MHNAKPNHDDMTNSSENFPRLTHNSEKKYGECRHASYTLFLRTGKEN